MYYKPESLEENFSNVLKLRDNFMNNIIVVTDYYILFRDKNPDNLQKRIRLLINGLASCGLNASQVSNDDLRLILDNFLNGGKTTEFGTVMPL